MVLQYLKNLIKPLAPIQMGVLPLALAAAPAVIKGVTGAIQMGKAKNITADPVSAATQQATSMAQQRALATQMPGEEQMKQNLQQSTAQTIANTQKAAASSADVLGGVAGAATAQNKALRDLGVQSAMYKDQAGQQYQQQLNIQGAEEERNRAQAQAAQQQMKQAGMQNIFGGLSDLSNIGLGQAMGLFDGAGVVGDDEDTGLSALGKRMAGTTQMQQQMAEAGFGQIPNLLPNLKGQLPTSIAPRDPNNIMGAQFGNMQNPLQGLLGRKTITI